MADDWRPLPRHTKLNYDECYAKVVLERFFPNEYQALQLSDRPDLRTKDGKVGVEVTSAIPQERQEALAIASEIPYCNPDDQKKKVDYLKKNGYEYTQYGMFGPMRTCRSLGLAYPDIENTFCKDFISAVKKKLQKLNSRTYDLLPRYNLFVQAEIGVEDWMPPKLLERLCQLSTWQYNFDFIYLLDLKGLFVFDITAHKYSVKETGEKLWGLGEIARKMVEEEERK